MMPTPDQATSAVLQALHALYRDPDSTAKKRANEWLEEFQHSVGGCIAWKCNEQADGPRAAGGLANVSFSVDSTGLASGR